MPMPGLPALRRHPKGAGLAVLFYLVTALLVPILHADTERLADTAAYELHHSAHCFPLHDEAVCPTCGAHETIALSAVVSIPGDAAATDALSRVPDPVAPPAPATAPPAARAPPRH